MKTFDDESRKMPSAENANKMAASLKTGESTYDQSIAKGTSAIEREETMEKTRPDHGSQYLVDKYNINDQAHSDSSLNDFVKTTSNFRHKKE